ncbi:MAG: acetamidase/formamidase family protein, partial [Actinomycetota bacterium]|nr:acetamidase/formamidase family protein [Actinomycetota bacterium]
MAEPLFRVDLGKSMADQEVPGHNRWHPDIPAAASTDPGTDFRIECLDWSRDIDDRSSLAGMISVDGSAPSRRDLTLTWQPPLELFDFTPGAAAQKTTPQ